MPQTATLTLPRPHAAQQNVIDGAKRFNTLACGRRWGKTVLGIDRIIAAVLKGQPAAWFAPSYKVLLDVWRSVTELLEPVTLDKSESERRLQVIGDGVVECWSTDSMGDSARGRKYGLAIVDEAALVPSLEQMWQATLRPMLADLKGGAWFLSTPRGLNDFKRIFDRGVDPERGEWASFQMPTSSNPYIAAEEIEAARQDMSEAMFAQEFLAQFIAWEGAVFRRVLEAVADPPEGRRACIIGVDWGRVSDYTVFTALSPAGEVLAIDRFRGLEYSLQRARLQAFWERFGTPWILAEQNNMGGPVIEQLQRDGLLVMPFTTTNASKAAIIEALALAFERGEIKIPNDAVLIAELQQFSAQPLPSGLMRYAAPAGQHDDYVLSLAIAWAGLEGYRVQQQQQDYRTMYWNPQAPGGVSEQPFPRVQISPF